MRVYEDPDLRLLVWNLEPGQENSVHVHPSFAQTLIVLEDSSAVLKGDNVELVPIKAGQCLVAPRGIPHGIRNTGVPALVRPECLEQHSGRLSKGHTLVLDRSPG